MLLSAVAGCGGGGGGSSSVQQPATSATQSGSDPRQVGLAAAATDEQAQGNDAAADSFSTTQAFSFDSATAGFETGLVKLAQIAGRLDERSDGTANVEIDWGDGTQPADAVVGRCDIGRFRNCIIWGTHLYTEAKTYTITVKYKLAGLLAEKQTITPKGTATVNAVSDFVVVSVGDSYYSGEGAPKQRWKDELADGEVDLGIQSEAQWDDPASNYSAQFPRQYDGNGNDRAKDGVPKTCHRSSAAGSQIVGRRIGQTNPITLVHMACSGAQLGFGKNQGARNTIGLINEQLAWVRTKVPRIDALLVSAGGNNVGFGSKAKDCATGVDGCAPRDDHAFDVLRWHYEQSALDIGCRLEEKADTASESELSDSFDDFDAAKRMPLTDEDEADEKVGDLYGAHSERGVLCAETQYASLQNLVPDGAAVELSDVSFRSLDERTILTESGKIRGIDSQDGCFNFLLDTNVEPVTLTMTRVENDICGVWEQGFDNTEFFGRTMYVRSELDRWTDVPDRQQRFVSMGDGTLQAEFEIEWGDTPNPLFKIASIEEYLIPGVTLINHYPDGTRNRQGDPVTNRDFAAYCPSTVSPADWANLHDNLVVPLENEIAMAKDRFGWREVRMPEAREHGYCVPKRDRWIVHLEESRRLQGQNPPSEQDLAGTAHPNAEGQQYYGRQIYDKLLAVNPPRTRATATAGGVPYEFDTVTASDVEVTLHSSNPLKESGVGTTYYSVNGERCTNASSSYTCTEYEGPFTISESGVHSVSFFSLNAQGTNGPETRVWPVTVHIDKNPPVMSCQPKPTELWPPNGRLQSVEVAVSAVDAVFGPMDFALTDILDSQDNAAEDVVRFEVGTPDIEGEMRSKRKGNGPGRTYSLIYESSDPVGNTARCQADVVVPHDQRPG